MKAFILAILLIASCAAGAQTYTLKGTLQDKADNSPLKSATIRLNVQGDSSSKYSVTSDAKGYFELRALPAQTYNMTISYVGYEPITQSVGLTADKDLGTVFITKAAKLLNEVTVTMAAPPVRQKTDTIEYSANAFKVNPDASGEDLVKKMPGITVDKGTVTAQGENVKKVTIDGREFFGDDATAALRNLPAEVIDKIQVFDRLSDQAQFTGFDDGNGYKAINIVTRANMRNGQFGRIFAGYGTEGRYNAGGNVSFFNGDRRISIVGLTNNVNQQNFSSQDLLGVTSSGGRTGGGGRGNRGGGGGGARGGGAGGGGGFQGGGNSNNFLVGTQEGISKTNSIGVNFSDLWGKKLTVSGSYFYNNSNTGNNQLSNEQYIAALKDSSTFYRENSLSNTTNNNHRVNLRFEYKIDSANSIIMTPTLSFQNNHAVNSSDGLLSYFNSGDSISRSINDNIRNTYGYNLSNNILYRHAFAKRGRSFSVGITTALNQKNGYSKVNAFTQNFQSTFTGEDSLQQLSNSNGNGYQLAANIAYTEPLGKKSQLQLNYNPSFTKSRNDQETFHFDNSNGKYSVFDSSLSNKFNNDYITQNGGVTYRVGDRDNMFSVGVSLQDSKLNSDQFFPASTTLNKSFTNFLPNLMLRRKLSARSSIRVFYRSSVNPPSITQLQNVINNTNPLFLSTGNPDLAQQYTNSVSGRYTYTNPAKGKTFFANLFVQQVQDYISNAQYTATNGDSVLTKSVTLARGSQLSKPVNLNGYWSVRSFFTYGMPLKFIKSNLNWNAGFSYVKSPGLINKQENISNSYSYNLGAVLASNISQYIDFTLSYSANFNMAPNTLQTNTNNNSFSQSAGIQFYLLSKKGWFLQNDLTNQYYSGLSGGLNQNYWLWNAAIGKKFLKDQSGELKLYAFDLLKQNRSITRTVNETSIIDVQNQVLQQYFMLSFTYKLRNFGKHS